MVDKPVKNGTYNVDICDTTKYIDNEFYIIRYFVRFKKYSAIQYSLCNEWL